MKTRIVLYGSHKSIHKAYITLETINSDIELKKASIPEHLEGYHNAIIIIVEKSSAENFRRAYERIKSFNTVIVL